MLKLDYEELYQLSLSQPEKVWDELGKEVVWSKPYHTVVDDKQSPTPNWFIGGEINMSYNCLDRAIEEGYGNEIAVIYESPVTETTKKITYKELLESVELFAGVMVEKCGIKKGDRVVIYFPVIPECLIGMLACTRIGAIYTVVFGGYSSKEITKRIEHTESKLILTCNVAFESDGTINYKERVDLAIKESSFTPDFCIVFNRPNTEPVAMIEGRDFDLMKEMQVAHPQSAVPVESNHPMFIMYTSGTTGHPKGLVMATGNSVVIHKYEMKYLFDIKEKDVMWMFSDFGWITGQNFMSYGPLLSRSRTILYEGKPVTTPDPGQIVRIMNKHKVISYMSSPTIMRILRNNCSERDIQLTYSDLRGIFIGGELSDQELRKWISTSFQCPVYDIFGQTELNGLITSPCLGFRKPTNSNSILALGFQAKIIKSETEEELPLESVGEILLKAPLGPYIALTLYKDHDRFIRTYFSKNPGYYNTYDYGKFMKDGRLIVLARTDDIIQVCAARICGGAVEESCLQNDNLINAAAVPMDDPITGQIPFAFLVKKCTSSENERKIIDDTIDLVQKNIGELALFRNAVIVSELPKTKSQKISRGSLAAMINNRVYQKPPAVENPEVYHKIYDSLIAAGYQATLPTDL